MKIVQVIHGYPLRYNAGSEVYTQTLCQALAKEHEVSVFTREENPFAEDFSLRIETDPDDSRIPLYLINIPSEKYRLAYTLPKVDAIFSEILEKLCPDVVHVGHLNHLSTSLVEVVAKKKIPLVFTLHDYWLMCPRGQFLQRRHPRTLELWPLCSGQENRKCALHCFSDSFSGAEADAAGDEACWTKWVDRRMEHLRKIASYVDLFIAPSRYLLERFVTDFHLPREKIVYLDYGFDRSRLQKRQREAKEPFTFGYIGTHIHAKGIQHLIEAFSQLKSRALLRIWGRARPSNTDGLKMLAQTSTLPIEWMGEYVNSRIMQDVFNQLDAIVVPSIWVENSPLVLHEALEAKVPIITARAGGMAEYIEHGVNGLLFEHRNPKDLALQMQDFLDHPEKAAALSARGYLQSADGHIPDIATHAQAIVEIYRAL